MQSGLLVVPQRYSRFALRRFDPGTRVQPGTSWHFFGPLPSASLLPNPALGRVRRGGEQVHFDVLDAQCSCALRREHLVQSGKAVGTAALSRERDGELPVVAARDFFSHNLCGVPVRIIAALGQAGEDLCRRVLEVVV